MTLDLSDKTVIIDDFIGGKNGADIINAWKKVDSRRRKYEILDLALIQRSIIEQLKGAKYDLILFVESGGVYFLGIPEIIRLGKKVSTLPLSSDFNPAMELTDSDESRAEIRKALRGLKSSIKQSSTIAIIEGDVGPRMLSLRRLENIKLAIQLLNHKAYIEVIAGVVTSKFLRSGLFNIVGVFVFDFLKLSDIAIAIERTCKKIPGYEPPNFDKKLLTHWHHRKTLPVPFKKK